MADRSIRAIIELRIEKAVAALKKLESSIDDASSSVSGLESDLEGLDDAVKPIQVKADTKDADNKIKGVINDLKQLSDPERIAIKAETDDIETKMSKLRFELRDLYSSDKSIEITADIYDVLKDIQTAESKLRSLESSDIEITPEVVLDYQEARADLKRLEGELKSLQGQRAEIEVNADAAKAVAEMEDLENQLRSVSRRTYTVDVDSKADTSGVDKLKSELKGLDDKQVQVKTQVDSGATEGLADQISGAAEAGGIAGGSLASGALKVGLMSSGIGAVIATVIGAAGPAIAGAAGTLGGFIMRGIQSGLDAEQALAKLSGQIGSQGPELGKLGRAAAKSYADNFGESIASNIENMTAIKANNLIDFSESETSIANLNSKLQNTADLLGEDVANTAEAAGALIKNGLASNATEAFDILTVSMQNGLNRSQDLLDTYREYPSMFQSLGLSGAEAAGLMSQAMEAGARNTDFVADALKEFSIRAQDGSKASIEAFESLGLSAEEATRKMATGGEDAKSVFSEVLTALNEIEDPVARNAAGVGLFGTKWEDLGNGAQIAAMNLESIPPAFKNIEGAAQGAMDAVSNTTAAKAEQAKRSLETAFASIGQSLSASLGPSVSNLVNGLSENMAPILTIIRDCVTNFIVFGGIAASQMAKVGLAALAVVDPLISIGEAASNVMLVLAKLSGNDSMMMIAQNAKMSMQSMRDFADGSKDALTSVADNAQMESMRMAASIHNSMSKGIDTAAVSDSINRIRNNIDMLAGQIESTQGKTITVNGDVLPAREALQELMTAIETSPDGTVRINGDSVPANEALDTFMSAVQTSNGNVKVSANTDQAKLDTDAAKMSIDGTQASIKVGADSSSVATDVATTKAAVDSTVGRIAIDADSGQAMMKKDLTKGSIDGTTGTMGIGANPASATGTLGGLKNTIDGTSGTVGIDGDASAGRGKLGGFTGDIDRSSGTVGIDGDPSAGQGKLGGFTDTVNNSSGSVKVDADTSTASRSLGSFIASASRSVINIAANIIGGGKAEGGFLPGRAAGGFVNYRRAPKGVDNVLYPLNAGGVTYNQPLAGGEHVTNAAQSKLWANTLTAINNGLKPSDLSALGSGMDTRAIAGAILEGMQRARVVADVSSDRAARELSLRGR